MIEYIDKHKCRLIISVGSGKDRKRYYKTVNYSGKRDAEKQHDDFKRQVQNVGMPEDMRLKELLDWHIESLQMLGTRATTLRGYRQAENRILLCCGNPKANSLTTYRIEKEICLNPKYSPKTIKNTISVLSSAYSKAMIAGILTDNPCEKVRLPKQKNIEIKTFNAQQIEKLLGILQDERPDFRIACELALFCGMRRSEVLGLTEDSIIDTANAVIVRQGRHRVDGDDIVTDTKNSSSRRTVAVPGFLMQEIKELIKHHHELPFDCSEFIIQNEFGEPMRPNYLSQRLLKIERANDLPEVSYHGLRHTHATMLNASGIDIARISAQLGHSNISTTLNIYTHIFGSQLESSQGIADEMEEMWQNCGRKAK